MSERDITTPTAPTAASAPVQTIRLEERDSSTHMEIERKWRAPVMDLEAIRNLGVGVSCVAIEQHYVSLDHMNETEVRIRSKTPMPFKDAEETKEKQTTIYTMTFKGKATRGGVCRVEEEWNITQAQFETMRALAIGRTIRKKRFKVPLLDLTHVAELDVFQEPAFMTNQSVVEVEFPSVEAADAFIAPSWFGVEVTRDKTMKNRAIAERAVRIHDCIIIRLLTSPLLNNS